MNKSGNGGPQGGGVGGGSTFAGVVAGPTASAAAQAAQRQRSLLQRADADIGSLLDNFSHLLKAARVRSLSLSLHLLYLCLSTENDNVAFGLLVL